MRRAAATLVLVLLLVLLAACSGPRNGLNTTASACFRGLPAASSEVGPKGKLIGVRVARRSELAAKLPQAGRIRERAVCVVAFRGTFVPGDVAGADPAGPGSFAVVALDTRGSHVLATFVVDQLPLQFRDRL